MRSVVGGSIGLAVASLLAIPIVALGVDRAVGVRPVDSVAMEVAVEGRTPAEMADASARLTNWLAQDAPATLEPAIRVNKEQINAIRLPEPTNGEPLAVGVVVPVSSRIKLDGIDMPTRASKADNRIGGGTLTRAADGGYVWTAAITSENAGGIRIHLDRVSLPVGTELYFYSQAGEAYGPFTAAGPDGAGPDGTGDFWTPSVFGSEGILQLRIGANATQEDLQNISLRVTELGHIGRSVFGLTEGVENVTASFCPGNASCIVNTNCVNEPIVNPNELAVAKMLWVSGAFIYTCSGGLIADTVSGTQIPYFLTANHCLSKSNNNLEAFFQYQASCGSTANCTGTWDDPPPGSFAGKTVGATVKKSGRRGDFTLLQLSQNPPAGSVFLGWTTTPVANTNGAALYRVSHPSGSPQSYSDQTVDTSAPTCQGWPRGERIYSRDGTGGTEGGSSGSPVVNSTSQIVGQLTGACGFNLNDVCDSVSNATVDGAFAYYFSQVQPFLAP